MCDDFDDDGYYLASKQKTKETAITNATPVCSEETSQLWDNIIEKEYMFVTPEELQLLKDSAEDYTSTTIELAGYVLGYDKKQLLVWLEETPIKLDDDQLELDIKEEEE